MKKHHYSIGELSRICRLSKKALRLYDSIGILSSQRNDGNNYRMYTHDDLLMVLILKYYKQMGFRLEEMKAFLSEGAERAIPFMRHSFEKKLNELRCEQTEIRRREQCVRDWQALLAEAELVLESGVRDISIKYLEPQELLCMEQDFDGDIKSSIINIPFSDYVESTGNAITGPVFHRFSSTVSRMEKKSQKILVMQDFLRPGGEGEKICFGGCLAATCYHIGDFAGIPDSYANILEWATRHGYELEDSCCERYVSDYWTGSNPDFHVAELMIRIRGKKSAALGSPDFRSLPR